MAADDMSTLNRRRWRHAAAFALMLLPMSAQAAQGCGLNGLLSALDPVTRGLVSGLLQLNCTASAQPVVFGNVNPTAGTVDYNGSIQISCTFSLLGTPLTLPPLLVCYDISLSAGAGTMATRQMKSGVTRSLNYNLYTNSSYSTVWGDGTSSSIKVSDSYLLPLGSSSRTYAVYGRIPAAQLPEVGNYLDSISVTVSY